MEDSHSERKRKVKFTSNASSNNDNKDNEKYKKINEQLTEIIKQINDNFDFKTYEEDKMLSIEKVINNHIIIFIEYIVLYRFKHIFK